MGGQAPVTSSNCTLPEHIIIPIPRPDDEVLELENELGVDIVDAEFLNEFIASNAVGFQYGLSEMVADLCQYIESPDAKLLENIYAKEILRRRRFDVFFAMFSALCELLAIGSANKSKKFAWRVKYVGSDYLVLGIPKIKQEFMNEPVR